YITYLGDGFFAVSIILFFLLFINMYEAVVLTTSVLISFCVVQFLKLHVFYEQVRPFKYFSETTPLHRAEGLEIHLYNSFPSGHSAQAFTLFLVITLFLKNKNWSPVFFSIALLVTISRIYLAQHFLIDTYFGALIASVLTMCTYLYFNTYTSLPKKERWQRGLLR
ncbi:MAG TPA: phosphatase PAP2 family protein, partial [Cytophagaceae bacterium]|nr:phosphatase PAP2 family protein [Cytophagaceae bacterium]